MCTFFTSDQERRLWLGTLFILAAIYSGLGFGGILADEFHNKELLGIVFVLCRFLVLVVIVTQGLNKKLGADEITEGLGVMLAFIIVIVRMGIPEAK